MITAADVADLVPGDVITVTGLNSTATGPLIEKDGALYIAGYLLVRDASGRPFPAIDTLTMVSRAPRPVYANTWRNPVAGDVARAADSSTDSRTWAFDGESWTPVGTGSAPGTSTPNQYRLLIDGDSGRFAGQ